MRYGQSDEERQLQRKARLDARRDWEKNREEHEEE
jgi:hypothetical protein